MRPDGALLPGRGQRATQGANPRQLLLWLMPVPSYVYGSAVTAVMPGIGC